MHPEVALPYLFTPTLTISPKGEEALEIVSWPCMAGAERGGHAACGGVHRHALTNSLRPEDEIG